MTKITIGILNVYYETGTAWKSRETGINRDYSAISATLGVARIAE